MESLTKFQDIDQKIKELQEKKKQLEQKQLGDIAKLLKRIGADVLPVEILIGGLEEILNSVKENNEKVKQWQRVGQEKMKKFSKTKRGEGESSMFRQISE